MNWQVGTTLGVLVAVVFGLYALNVGADLILLGGLALLLLTGIVEPADAFAGFGNPGLITVAVLFAVAEGLNQTGAMTFIGHRLLGHPKSTVGAQSRMMFPVAIASAFLNNTPVVAMMMPVTIDWARKHKLSVSSLLIPLSYAAVLGGMCTLIGTSTTLVLDGKLKEVRGEGLGMFEIAAVGVPAAIAGLVYVVICGRWLLPKRTPAIEQLEDPREYSVEMVVDEGSSLVGKTIEEAGLRHLPSMYLLEIDREGHVLPAVASDERLRSRDRLVFVGVVESVVDLRKIPGLTPATDQKFQFDAPASTRQLIEAVVSSRCPFVGVSIRDAKFRTHYSAAVIAVAREGQRIDMKIGDIVLRPGDTLLLEAHASFVKLQRNSRDFFLVSEVQNSRPPRHERSWVAQTILLGMVIVVAFGMLSMLKAALLAAGLMIAARCCRGSEAKRAVDWSVLIVMGAGLGIGKAMESSQTDKVIAEALINGTQAFLDLFGQSVNDYPRVLLALTYLLTMFLTNLITAKAAAFLVFPIAMATAGSLDVEIMPFAITVMIAAAASFATPIGYQTNLMVYGPGGYRYSDYLRIGGPLTVIVWIITIVIAPLVWPFG